MLDGTGHKSGSGIYINSETAMRQSTVYACVRVISEIIAQLPIEVQTKSNNTWITAQDHDLNRLLAEPNQWQTQHDLISTLIAWAEMNGNGFLFKIRTGDDVVRQLIPIESKGVETEIKKNWELEYTVDSDVGINGTYKKDRVFHLRNFGTQGYIGLSTIGNHKEGIGLALQLEKHAVSAYKNGLQSNKWVKLENPLHGDALDTFKSEIKKYQGASAAGEMPVLAGSEFKEFNGISQTDAQYIESRKMQKQEIASLFGVPLFLLNDTEKTTTWGTGLEQMSRSFIRFSLNPRLNRLGQTFVRELIPEKERSNTRVIFDTDQFTLGEFKERMDGYRSGIESGVLNPNECREIEGRNPRDGGDDYRQPANINTEGDTDEPQDI